MGVCELVGGGGGLQHVSVSPRPLGTNSVFDLNGTGLGHLDTKGLGLGLDNFNTKRSISRSHNLLPKKNHKQKEPKNLPENPL